MLTKIKQCFESRLNQFKIVRNKLKIRKHVQQNTWESMVFKIV